MSFRGPDGTRSTDPRQLMGPRAGVDLAALGLLFAPPALLGEFYPAAPWNGISLQPAIFGGATSVAPLRVAFPAAVSTLIADTDVVAVKFSGGIDSLAVLAQVCRAGDGRRVVAVTVDLVDDDGVHAADTARRLVHGLDLDCELVVIDPARHRREISAPWSPIGPRLDALPQFNALVADTAHTAGAGVLLSGDGADEVLEVPPFAATVIASARGLRAAARYVADMSGRGGGLLVELAAAAAATLLPAAARARAYWALSWEDTLGQAVSPVLASPFREIATEWARAWCTARIEDHIAGGGSWAEQAAWDAIWPHDPLLPAGPVAEDSPFLTDTVLAAAQQLGPADRFDPRMPTAYQRCKAAAVELFEPAQRPRLPRHKQYFRHALAQLTRGRTTTAERSIAAGLVDPDAWAANTDLAVTMMVAAVEDWLAGAEAIGAHIPGVSP